LGEVKEADVPYNMYYDHSGPGAWWIVGVIAMVVFWGLVAMVILAAIRHYSAPRVAGPPTHAGPVHPVAPPAGESALDVLRMRLARGEINEDEYTSRRRLLDDTK
jgi:putative membrane protein